MKPIEDIKILVVGDIMLDMYVVGSVERISPEAPVPIVNVIEEYSTLGGCGNVARNIIELGAKVDCLASIAHDLAGITISQKIIELGITSFLFAGSPMTTVKERIIADHRLVQMLRIDREEKKTVSAKDAIEVLKKHSSNNYDVIVISDYAKGMISYELIKYIKENMKGKIIVDPKPTNDWMYNGVFMLTPNEKEWMEMQLSSSYVLKGVQYILKTMGKKGMKLMHDNKELYIEAEPVDIYNVSGAGDTVNAIVAVCLSMGISVEDSASIANKCAAYVVTQPGTAIVPRAKFEAILKNYI